MNETTYTQFTNKVHGQQAGRRAPLEVSIEVTRRCPLECLHCYNNLPMSDMNARAQELTLAEHCKLLDELSAAGKETNHVAALENGVITMETATKRAEVHPDLRGGMASENAAEMRALLAGAGRSGHRAAVLINAAAALFVAGGFGSVIEALRPFWGVDADDPDGVLEGLITRGWALRDPADRFSLSPEGDAARSALLADPSNGYVSGHLVEARRRKLDLLRRTAALVAEAKRLARTLDA